MSFSSFKNVTQNIRDNRNIECVGFGSVIDSDEEIEKTDKTNNFSECFKKLENLIKYENNMDIVKKNKILKIFLILCKMENFEKKMFFKKFFEKFDFWVF